MAQRRILRSECFQNETLWTRARVLREYDGTALLPADVLTYDVQVFNVDAPTDPELAIFSITGGAATDVVSSAYSTVGWEEDTTGWNVHLGLASGQFARHGGDLLRVQLTLNTVSEGSVDILHLSRQIAYWPNV